MPDKFAITDIPIGREHSISRDALARKWQVTDRVARRYVLALRLLPSEDGYIIMSSSHDKGYWRTNESSEIRQYINETEARAKHKIGRAHV